MPACDFSGIFMTRKVPGSLSEVSRLYLTKPTKNDFRKDCGKTLFLHKVIEEYL